jgi:mono/diheme cytochrome c family protein
MPKLHHSVSGGVVALACGVSFAQSLVRAPQIWSDTDLADWATPIAALNTRPAHYSSDEYYRIEGDNLRTYPVYDPGSEPAGYWEDLQKKQPEPLVDVAKIRNAQDWIDAGRRAFIEIDAYWTRTSDPTLIAAARNPRNFEGVLKRADGTVGESRWVVTRDGVSLSRRECGQCHREVLAAIGAETPEWLAAVSERMVSSAGGGARLEPAGLGDPRAQLRALPRYFIGDTIPMAMWRKFTVPWAPDERIERLRTVAAKDLSEQELQRMTQLGATAGGFPRVHGSPYFGAKRPDLRVLKYSRYLDATGTHRLRGPEDVGRYAAFVTGADRMEFGPHQILTNEQRRVRFRYADEVLYAIGMFLMSLEPPKSSVQPPADVRVRGEQVFTREGCINCHVPPAYTNGKLTPASGWQPPVNHPDRADIISISVGTDAGLALATRKGTGFYKVPSLRGVWDRPFLLHDGSLTSLEQMFDAARLDPQYQPKGWNPPGVRTRAVPGHTFGLSLSPDDKTALLAFLRSL